MSRGIDSISILWAAGTTLTRMMTSLRWPPVSAPHPNALHWPALLTNARESEPATKTVNGAPGFETCVEIGYFDLLYLVELVVQIEEPTESEQDDEQHHDSGSDERTLGPPPPLGRPGSTATSVGGRAWPCGCLPAAGRAATGRAADRSLGDGLGPSAP